MRAYVRREFKIGSQSIFLFTGRRACNRGILSEGVSGIKIKGRAGDGSFLLS